jgi:hypothetical protein
MTQGLQSQHRAFNKFFIHQTHTILGDFNAKVIFKPAVENGSWLKQVMVTGCGEAPNC